MAKTANSPQNVPSDVTSDGIPLFEGCPSVAMAGWILFNPWFLITLWNTSAYKSVRWDFASEQKQSLIHPHPQPFSRREKDVRISYYTERPFSTCEKVFRD